MCHKTGLCSHSCDYVEHKAVNMHVCCRYTFFIALYPIGVTGELLCFYAAQAFVANKKLWTLEMPNKLNFTFSYHYFLLFMMFLYIPRESILPIYKVVQICTGLIIL